MGKSKKFDVSDIILNVKYLPQARVFEHLVLNLQHYFRKFGYL